MRQTCCTLNLEKLKQSSDKSISFTSSKKESSSDDEYDFEAMALFAKQLKSFLKIKLKD